MVNTIDMQDLRNLNLFSRITRVSTRFCFTYNEGLVFCVPKPLLSRAIGKQGKNVKEIYGILRKRVRIISQPRGIEDVKEFIKSIVYPIEFKDLEVKDTEVVLTAGPQSKASLLGRNKRRLLEMQKIVKGFFGMDFRIV